MFVQLHEANLKFCGISVGMGAWVSKFVRVVVKDPPSGRGEDIFVGLGRDEATQASIETQDGRAHFKFIKNGIVPIELEGNETEFSVKAIKHVVSKMKNLRSMFMPDEEIFDTFNQKFRIVFWKRYGAREVTWCTIFAVDMEGHIQYEFVIAPDKTKYVDEPRVYIPEKDPNEFPMGLDEEAKIERL